MRASASSLTNGVVRKSMRGGRHGQVFVAVSCTEARSIYRHMTYVVCVPSLAGLRDTVINTREQVGVVRVTLLLLLRHSVEKRIAEAKRSTF